MAPGTHPAPAEVGRRPELPLLCACTDWKAGHKLTCSGKGGSPSPKPAPPPAWAPFTPSPDLERRIRVDGGRQIPCTGLDNVGNTCFINCTLQCLLHSPPAWHYLSSQQHRRKGACGAVSFCMHCELERLAEQYQAAEKQRHFAPRSIVRECAGLFAMGDMHDSQVTLAAALSPQRSALNLILAPTLAPSLFLGGKLH